MNQQKSAGSTNSARYDSRISKPKSTRDAKTNRRSQQYHRQLRMKSEPVLNFDKNSQNKEMQFSAEIVRRTLDKRFSDFTLVYSKLRNKNQLYKLDAINKRLELYGYSLKNIKNDYYRNKLSLLHRWELLQ